MQLLVSRIALSLCALVALVNAAAQTTAPKTIRIIVPFTAGASNDAIARALAGALAKRLEARVKEELAQWKK